MAKTTNTEIITLNPIDIKTATIRIVGDSPLIMHKWSVKAQRELLDSMTSKNKTKKKGDAEREAKDPEREFIDSMYWLEHEPADDEKDMEGFEKAIAAGARFGFPASSVKLSAITAAYRLGMIPNMAILRGAFFIIGEGEEMLVEIKGDSPVMRRDMVRVGMGKPDVRFRGQFTNWYADLSINYNASGVYSLEKIVNCINAGGYACGLGEWRPDKDGQYGMYHVASVTE